MTTSAMDGIPVELIQNRVNNKIHASRRLLTTASRIFTRMPRIVSSQITPPLVAHWNAPEHESLISCMYCTPLVASTRRLAPDISGPKHQIFRASVTSQPYSSASSRARALISSRALTLPSSIACVKTSSMGVALTKRRLCLFCDLARATIEDSACTVSR